MRTEEPRPVRLQDYRPPDWLIETVELDVSLDPTATTVRAKLKLKPNSAGAPAPLVLDGEELELRSLLLDGKPLPAENFVATPDRLTIAQPPNRRVRSSRSRPSSIPRATRSSWVFTAPARPIARNARPRAFGASPIFSTGRT